MKTIIHEKQPKEEWRAGVVTRMRVSSLTGATAMCIFEQWCEPGAGAPLHSHNVEEVLSVLGGKMEVHLGDERVVLMKDESVIIPAGLVHGFRNIGGEELHVEAILAAPYFEAVPSPQGEASVRWKSPTIR